MEGTIPIKLYCPLCKAYLATPSNGDIINRKSVNCGGCKHDIAIHDLLILKDK